MSEEEQIILPSGYTKLEWIGNFVTTNTSTNCKIILPLNFDFFKDGTGDSSLIFETEHALTSLVHDQAEGISYGSTTQANNEEFFWLLYNNYIGTHAGEFISFTNLKPQIDEFIKIKLIWTPNLVTFEVTYKGETYSNSKVPTSTWSCTEIGLFHKLLGEKAQASYKSLCGKKKYCKIWKNGELLYNLIPCLDNENTACMFDLVSQQAFYNQGTGRFLTNKDFEFGYIHTPYNLPSGFKKCVYLQSDGTQWINTQVVPDSETGLYLRALRLNYGPYVSFGVNEGGNEMYPPRFDNSNLYFRWGTTSTKMMTWDKAGDFNFSSYLNFYNSKIAKFNSDDTDVYSPITSSTKTFTIPIWLFSYNSNGSFNTTYGKWGGRIYRAQITQGDTLIRDFVPCLDADNRPCMYDLVTQEPYYNQSGGTEFAYCVEHQLPSDFIKLKYLESTGTQIIKTGYVPTDSTGIYIDAYHTKHNGNTNGSVIGLRNTNGNTYFFAPRVQRDTNGAGFGWGAFTTPGGNGNVRYEASLNFLNDRQSIITAPAFAQRINALETLSFTPTKDLYMFGMNNYDGAATLYSTYRIYRAKISEGSEVVRDWVPTMDNRNSRPCMYDLINNAAYYNDGAGEFIYNRDFEGTYTGFNQLGGIGNRLGTDTQTDSSIEFINEITGIDSFTINSKIEVKKDYRIKIKTDAAHTYLSQKYTDEWSETLLMPILQKVTIPCYKNSDVMLETMRGLEIDWTHVIDMDFVLGQYIHVVSSYNSIIEEDEYENIAESLTGEEIYTPRTADENGLVLALRHLDGGGFFEMKIYNENNKLLTHLVPAKNKNNEIGVYCKVRHEFIVV